MLTGQTPCRLAVPGKINRRKHPVSELTGVLTSARNSFSIAVFYWPVTDFRPGRSFASVSICALLDRPTRRLISRPSLKRISVGIPLRLKRGETDGLSSTLILYTLASPASFSAAASTAGDIARHGAHQGAQKSTRIGSLDWRSS